MGFKLDLILMVVAVLASSCEGIKCYSSGTCGGDAPLEDLCDPKNNRPIKTCDGTDGCYQVSYDVFNTPEGNGTAVFRGCMNHTECNLWTNEEAKLRGLKPTTKLCCVDDKCNFNITGIHEGRHDPSPVPRGTTLAAPGVNLTTTSAPVNLTTTTAAHVNLTTTIVVHANLTNTTSPVKLTTTLPVNLTTTTTVAPAGNLTTTTVHPVVNGTTHVPVNGTVIPLPHKTTTVETTTPEDKDSSSVSPITTTTTHNPELHSSAGKDVAPTLMAVVILMKKIFV